jgi:branched-chain amino acid transport system ATP-binding protein
VALLEVQDIQAGYGSIIALHGVSLRVEETEIVTIIGANGAGKSTTLRSISGLVAPSRGTITFAGTRTERLPPQAIVRLGISHVPEGRRLFARMTVMENLELGAHLRRDGDRRADFEHVFELFPRLAERRDQAAGTLSGGEQQMLAMGRALMARPVLLLLDEPSMGLAPHLVHRIYRTIAEISARGTTIVLVEQNANYALDTASRAYVMEAGTVVMEGDCRSVRSSPDVQRAYLGT